jgi:pre-mRNA-splicing factor CWC26
MSGKLAYLSKYNDSSLSHDKKKKKRKKHKKETVDIHDLDEDPRIDSVPDDDSNDEDAPIVVVDNNGASNSSQAVARGAARRRHDSDDSSVDSHPRRHRRRRHDSESDGSSGEQRHNRRRHDSDEDETAHEKNGRHHHRRRRHDSSSDEADARTRRRRRHDSESDSQDDGSKKGKRMSSGHSSGLQNAAQFKEAETKLQRKKRKLMANMANDGPAETIYRDKSGRKVDMMQQVMDQESRAKDAKLAAEVAQTELTKGRVQKEADEQRMLERQAMEQQPFARSVTDTGLEEWRKDTIREGDPMAIHAMKQQRNKKTNQPARPVYKGPQPKPNRFGIRPGYRWDGVDRGNGFEDKVLSQQHSSNRKKEDAYKWSSADM